MRRRRLAPLALLAFAAASACRTQPALPPPAPALVAAPAPPPAPPAPAARLSPAEIAARAMPAICTVRTEHGLGTGFVVDRAAGLVATNLHVIAGAPEIVITFDDRRVFPVVEIGAYSALHDLALLRVEGGLPAALTLGDSDALRPGDPIVAIGDPLGLEHTVSNGLVSAIRSVDADLVVLQISAPIAPGSSGGPIFDERGEVVGIATILVRGGQNLAFGMPSRYVKDLLAAPSPISPADLATRLGRPPSAPALPHPKRAVPHHPVALLAGCPDSSLKRTVDAIGSAVDVGAPLYNHGNFAACYHEYEGAAQDLERKLPPSCKGPVRALAAGRAKAAGLADAADQAWAMRDAFDGLMDVIARKLRGEKD